MDISFYPKLEKRQKVDTNGNIVETPSINSRGRPKVIATRETLVMGHWQLQNPGRVGEYVKATDSVNVLADSGLEFDLRDKLKNEIKELKRDRKILIRDMEKRQKKIDSESDLLEERRTALVKMEQAQNDIEASLGIADTNDLVELASSGIPVLAKRAIILAAKSNQVSQVMSVLKELNDRAFGKPVQGVIHGGQVGVDVTIADVLSSIDGKTSGLPVIDSIEVKEEDS